MNSNRVVAEKTLNLADYVGVDTELTLIFGQPSTLKQATAATGESTDGDHDEPDKEESKLPIQQNLMQDSAVSPEIMALKIGIKSKADTKNRRSNFRGSSVDKNYKVLTASGAKSGTDR